MHWSRESKISCDLYLFPAFPLLFRYLCFGSYFTKCIVNISDNSCYNGSGETYAGRKNVSKSGRPCRAWPTMDPPGHNFCRNPDGHRTRPWCYVGQDNEKESCDVKKCSTIGKWSFTLPVHSSPSPPPRGYMLYCTVRGHLPLICVAPKGVDLKHFYSRTGYINLSVLVWNRISHAF